MDKSDRKRKKTQSRNNDIENQASEDAEYNQVASASNKRQSNRGYKNRQERYAEDELDESRGYQDQRRGRSNRQHYDDEEDEEMDSRQNIRERRYAAKYTDRNEYDQQEQPSRQRRDRYKSPMDDEEVDVSPARGKNRYRNSIEDEEDQDQSSRRKNGQDDTQKRQDASRYPANESEIAENRRSQAARDNENSKGEAQRMRKTKSDTMEHENKPEQVANITRNTNQGNVTQGGSQNMNKSQMNQSNLQNRSARIKKEKKNLQKYDSNSIDEEEFQDYFSNPQKRKEFDRQRLQQQMKEIQNIAGFQLGQYGNKSMKQMKEAFPAYPGADVDPSSQDKQQKNYATVSLCCLSVTNPFRNKIIQLVAINPWFDWFILVVIIVNCFFLAIDKDSSIPQSVLDTIDLVFLIIYTSEMVLKVVAMGFFMRPHSYLRDPWNVLDFVVVIMGWVSSLLQQQNISAIRVMRILRPLRTINSMPGMSGLVSTILNSLPIMFDIMVLFGFMLIMFGTIATQLLGGHLYKRCKALNHNGEMSKFLGISKKEVFCITNADCDVRVPDDIKPGAATCQVDENPIDDTLNFDNIFMSILNIFQIITLEGWTEMMYIIRESEQTFAYDLFFILCVLFGAFFVLNLMIAVQFTYLGEAFDEEERRQKELQAKIKQKKQIKQQHEDDDSLYDDDEEDESDQSPQEFNEEGKQKSQVDAEGNRIGRKRKKGFCRMKKIPMCVKASIRVEGLVNNERFGNMIIGFIMLNTVVLACEQYEQPLWLTTASDIANYVFTLIFALEMVLKLFGLGIKEYVADGFNIFDAIIVILSLLELVQESEKSGLSVLRAFRLTRIFKIIKSWTSLRILLSTVLESLSAISNLGFLTLLYLFIFSLLAKQFFGGDLKDHQGGLSRYSFDTTAQAFRTIFIILTGENWNEIMIQVMVQQKDKTLPALFFSLMMMIGNYMLLNLFLAILLKFISENGEDDDNDDTRDETIKSITKEEDSKDASGKVKKQPTFDALDLNDSAPLNSSNSNIEEEFEQIKMQLQQLSNMNTKQFKQQEALEKRKDKKIGKKQIRSEESEDPDSNRRSVKNSEADREFEGGHGNTRDQRNNENEEESYEFSNSQEAESAPQSSKPSKVDFMTKNQQDTMKIKSFASRSVSASKKKQKKTIEIDETSRSLFIFGHDNDFRLFLKKVVENPYFEGFIYHMIALNSLLLALDTPSLKDEYQKQTLKTLLFAISIIFIVEMAMKVIVMGFYFVDKAYLKDSFNVLDFTIVFFSILTMIMESFEGDLDISFIRGFRALRALRPLRVVSKNEGIKTVVNSLLLSIPSLLNVLLIIILFLLVFGILGVQLFKGGIANCNNTNEYEIEMTRKMKPFSANTPVEEIIKYLEKKGNVLIKNKTDCLREKYYKVKKLDKWDEWNGKDWEDELSKWEVPENNYNNVFNSMLTFFEISTLEMWPQNMFAAVDLVGYDMVPRTDNSPSIALIFVIFIFLTTFFIMNLFISVIVDKFNEEIKKRQGAHNFTEEQKEWVKIQRLLVHTNPKIIPVEPINCLRLQCFKVVQSQAFEYFIMAAIVINTLFLCIDYHQKGPELTSILNYANNVFVFIFTIEMLLKIVAYGFSYYWHVNWNKFDFIIVIMSLLALDETLMRDLNFNVTALRIIRVSRLLRMVKTSQGLRSLLKTLYLSLGNILQTAMLLMLILFTFAVAGMSLFGTIPYKDNDYYQFINKNANFESFYTAISTLWRACTGESWNGIMHECVRAEGVMANIYWILFQLLTFFIFMNVFIAVIYENFNDIQASEDENDILSLKKKDIKAFQSTWAKYNPMGELYMRTLRLPDFLRELPPPLGYQGIRIEDSKLNKIIFCLNIRDHTGKVYYPEVMWTIFHSIVGINDEKVNNCEQIVTILKIVKQKYKGGLAKKINLDSLCGNKYYRNELTAIKYIQAMKILNKWRNYKNMRIKQKEQEMMKKLTIDAKVIELGDDDEPQKAVNGRNSPTKQPQSGKRNQPDDQEVNVKDERVKNIKKQIQQNKEEVQMVERRQADEVQERQTRRGATMPDHSSNNSNQENFPSSRRGMSNDRADNSAAGQRRNVQRKKRYSPGRMEDDDYSPESQGNAHPQQRRNPNRYLDNEEDSMDMEADMGGMTERNPMSARNGRDRHLKNSKKGTQRDQDDDFRDPEEVKLNFHRKTQGRK